MSGRLRLEEIEKYVAYKTQELRKTLNELEQEHQDSKEKDKNGQTKNKEELQKKIITIKEELKQINTTVQLQSKTEKGSAEIKTYIFKVEKQRKSEEEQKQQEQQEQKEQKRAKRIKQQKEEIFRKLHPEYDDIVSERKMLSIHLDQLQERIDNEKDKQLKKKLQEKKEILSSVYQMIRTRETGLSHFRRKMKSQTLEELESILKQKEQDVK